MSLSYRHSIRIAIAQHGGAWRDYFSLQIDSSFSDEEFHEEKIPGCTRLDEEKVNRELHGSGGIPNEFKRRKKEHLIG